MNLVTYFFSPFEQFVIVPVFSANFFILGENLNVAYFPIIDYTISNITLIFFIFLVKLKIK
jgi:hypothetical protein